MPREAGSKIMMYFTVILLLTDLNKDLKCSVSKECVKVPASLNSQKFKLSLLMESDWCKRKRYATAKACGEQFYCLHLQMLTIQVTCSFFFFY